MRSQPATWVASVVEAVAEADARPSQPHWHDPDAERRERRGPSSEFWRPLPYQQVPGVTPSSASVPSGPRMGLPLTTTAAPTPVPGQDTAVSLCDCAGMPAPGAVASMAEH